MPADVIIAIPTFNEASTIAGVIQHFLDDMPEASIVVVDGASTDQTPAIVKQFGPDIQLIHNPAQRQSAGLNMAAHWAQQQGARVLVRADAHASYPKGFVRGVVQVLDSERADSVVVPLLAAGTHGWQGANAILQQGWLGHGGAAHRKPSTTCKVTHGHHAAFRLSAFQALGGYDPDFIAAEDVDFDIRLTANGSRIFMAGQFPVSYFPRATPVATYRQYFRNGTWRARLWRKHRILPSLRQSLPLIAGLGWPACLTLSPVAPLLLLPAAAYFTLVFGLSALQSKAHVLTTLRVATLALLTHTGFAFGILSGLSRPLKLSRPHPVSA